LDNFELRDTLKFSDFSVTAIWLIDRLTIGIDCLQFSIRVDNIQQYYSTAFLGRIYPKEALQFPSCHSCTCSCYYPAYLWNLNGHLYNTCIYPGAKYFPTQ